MRQQRQHCYEPYTWPKIYEEEVSALGRMSASMYILTLIGLFLDIEKFKIKNLTYKTYSEYYSDKKILDDG